MNEQDTKYINDLLNGNNTRLLSTVQIHSVKALRKAIESIKEVDANIYKLNEKRIELTGVQNFLADTIIGERNAANEKPNE